MHQALGKLILTAAVFLLPTITAGQTNGEPDRRQLIGGATVSARLVNELFSRPIQQNTSIRENIMGATTNGTARTQARVLAEFLPDHRKAVLNIRLRGTIVANNSSQRGRVTVFSGSRTRVDASKQIYLGMGQLTSAEAVAQCSTSMWIRDIEAGRRLIERLARRRVERMRGEIESTTSQRAAREIETQLDQEVAKLTGQMESGTEGSLTGGDLPIDFRFQTSRQRLFVSLLGDSHRSGANLGVPAAQYDLGFSAHETLLEIAFAHLIGGKRIADEHFLNTIDTISGDAPRPLWVHERQDRWSVVMAQKPVEITFADNGFTVTLLVNELKVGAKTYRRPAKVRAAYKLRPTPDGPHLTRSADLVISIDGSKDKAQASIRSFLDHKLSAFFQPDLYFDGMVPPVGGSGGRLRQLQLKRLSTDRGWLVMGYQLPTRQLAASAAERSE